MTRKSTPKRKSQQKVEQEPDVFDLQDIVDYECRGGEDYYYVLWRGYSVEDGTWEPRTNILDPCDELVAKMNQLKSSKQKSSKAPAAASTTSRKSESPTSRSRKRVDYTGGKSEKAQSDSTNPSSNKVRRVNNSSNSTAAASASNANNNSNTNNNIVAARVRGIRQDKTGGMQVTMQFPQAGANPVQEQTMSIDEAMRDHPHELLTFLVGKIQWKGSSGGGSSSSRENKDQRDKDASSG